MKKEWAIILITTILCYLMFLLLIPSKNNKIDIVEVEKPVYYEDLERINKLEGIIESQELKIDSLKSGIVKIKEVVRIEKEYIRKLEPDSGVIVLRNNLEEYTGEINDSLPTIQEDSLIVLDNTDLKNINSVFLDYKADLKIINNQLEIIKSDSLIKNDLRTMIETQDNINGLLESAIREEKRSKEIWKIVGITGISTTIILAILNIW